MQDDRQSGNYFEIKAYYLEKVAGLLETQQNAIMLSNFEALNVSLKGVEELQIKIDNLDREHPEVKSMLSELERKQLKKMLTNILGLSRTNEQLLAKSKDAVLSDVKTTRLKKSVRSAYGGLTPNAASMRSLG